MNSDTQLGINDTQIMYFPAGKSVRILHGDLRGATGKIVEQRDGGQLLLDIAPGTFVVVGQVFVELLEQ
ncbi:MAG: hypothetical protein KDA55_17360 [Planctomycetales bacterium]|nr:hypothetical protein [Planctomycetales bacterium]MCA9233217.1 hypothetical protein [Planctomycetales bacterium]